MAFGTVRVCSHVFQVLRVLPYSAAQLYAYDALKRRFADEDGKLSVPARLAAGACAGMISTLVRPARVERARVGFQRV
jgi:solute carrier family 25 (mitochondrial phosphate transporter), member 23/24/25/41